jgi:predicted porin
MKDDPRATNTLNGNATYTNIPVINSSLSLSANLMQTSYLDGQVYGIRLSKDIVPGKIYGMLNYRWVKFNYVSSATQLTQNIGEIDLSYRINKKLYLSVNYEATFQPDENFNRLYLNLRWKF